MIYTTLNKIRRAKPCKEGWEQLLANLGKTKADDEPLPLTTILDSNGLDDCLWALCTVPGYDSLWRKYAVWCARQVEHLMTDGRSKRTLDVAWRHAEGKATDEELEVTMKAARAAAAEAARAAAWVAAWEAAIDEAEAWEAAMAAARAAAEAARATAWEAARLAARLAAWAEAGAAQETKLRTILSAGEW